MSFQFDLFPWSNWEWDIFKISLLYTEQEKCSYKPLLKEKIHDLMQAFHRGGVFLGILDGGVPNPDPISDQKMSFSTPVFRPDLKAKIMSSFLRLKRKQKISSNTFRIRIFLLNLELKRWLKYVHTLRKPRPPSPQNQKWENDALRGFIRDLGGRGFAVP